MLCCFLKLDERPQTPAGNRNRILQLALLYVRLPFGFLNRKPRRDANMLKTYRKLIAESNRTKALAAGCGVKQDWFTRFCFWVDPLMITLFLPLIWLVEKAGPMVPPPKRYAVIDDDDDDPGTTAWYTD